MPALSPALEAEVERHWQAACRERTLFNGHGVLRRADLAGADRRAIGRSIAARWRRCATMRCAKPCGSAAWPCAGCCAAADGVVVGRRQAEAIYEAGLWQLPPAGSVDSGAAEPGGASWRRALLAELAEELGLPADEREPDGAALPGAASERRARSWDPDGHGAGRRRGGGGASGGGNREYDRLLIAPDDAVQARVAAEGGRLVTSAHAFLARLNRAGPGAS